MGSARASRAVFRALTEDGPLVILSRRQKKVRAYNGEIADEVHEFLNATQGEYRLKKILLRDGRVIELCFQW